MICWVSFITNPNIITVDQLLGAKSCGSYSRSDNLMFIIHKTVSDYVNYYIKHFITNNKVIKPFAIIPSVDITITAFFFASFFLSFIIAFKPSANPITGMIGGIAPLRLIRLRAYP